MFKFLLVGMKVLVKPGNLAAMITAVKPMPFGTYYEVTYADGVTQLVGWNCLIRPCCKTGVKDDPGCPECDGRPEVYE